MLARLGDKINNGGGRIAYQFGAYETPMLLAKTFFVLPATPQSDLTFWSEAAVRDRLKAFYIAKIADVSLAGQAARLHWSIWRSYLNDLAVPARASRQALTKWLVDAGLSVDLIEAGDAIVIDELAELISQRFRRAPLQAKAYTKCLVAAATRLGQARN